ncbi:glycosyltransferase family 4 protein [uncultured Bacteroides sp.]|uniref:glycosyltransferase family 4 protein n=1 Tax=uncultured Bacteroides sp. TaxID=162156 RepID=UPI002AAB89F4|nr:glycosyltransferase family 4 protein [uncultured Bacteroides sp.]
MKIAIITAGVLPFPPIKGGAVENLIDSYIKYNEEYLDHKLTVFSIDDKHINKTILSEYHKTNFIFINTHKYIYKALFFLKKRINKYHKYTENIYLNTILDTIKNITFDYIIIENRPEFVLPIYNASNSKLILHLHNDTLNPETKEADKIVLHCCKVLCVSNFIKNRVLDIKNIDKNKIYKLYNGIDINLFHFNHIKREEIRNRFGVKNDELLLCFSGRLTQEKGLYELLLALDLLLKEKRVKIKLLVLGSIFYGKKEEETTYKKMLQEQSCKNIDHIIFTGYVPYNEIPDYLSAGDIAVLPSIWEEPFGLTILECMSIGLPVISSDSGGIPEIVDNKSGILVKRSESFVKDLSNAILDLINNQEKRENLAKYAAIRAHKFTKENFCEHIFSILSQ